MFKRIIGFYLFITTVFIFNSCKESKLASSYVVRNKLIEREEGDIDTAQIQTRYWTYDRKNRSYFEMAKFSYADQKGLLFTSDIYHNSARLGLNDKYEKVKYYVLSSEKVKKLYEFIDMLKHSAGDQKGKYRVDYTIDKNIFVSCITFNNVTADGRVVPSIQEITLWMYGRKHQLSYRKFVKQLNTIVNKDKS